MLYVILLVITSSCIATQSVQQRTLYPGKEFFIATDSIHDIALTLEKLQGICVNVNHVEDFYDCEKIIVLISYANSIYETIQWPSGVDTALYATSSSELALKDHNVDFIFHGNFYKFQDVALIIGAGLQVQGDERFVFILPSILPRTVHQMVNTPWFSTSNYWTHDCFGSGLLVSSFAHPKGFSTCKDQVDSSMLYKGLYSSVVLQESPHFNHGEFTVLKTDNNLLESIM